MTELTSQYQLSPLVAESVQLVGRHLIEASAGTGKTFNITRLYLRLILERNLSVRQILVMTFTTAATEELKGRIERELHRAAENWDQLVASGDSFYVAIQQRVGRDVIIQRLRIALASVDEAAVFTIHSFCKRVLTQEAFASQLPLDIAMEVNTTEWKLQAIRDWLRGVNDNPDDFELLSRVKSTKPEGFYKQYGRLIGTAEPIYTLTETEVETSFDQSWKTSSHADFAHEKLQIFDALLKSKGIIFSAVVEGHKDAEERQNEWAVMLEWLQDDASAPCPKAVRSFVNGNRFRSKVKADLMAEASEHLDGVRNLSKSINDAYKKWSEAKDVALAHAGCYQLIEQGIHGIRERFSALKRQHRIMDFDDLIFCLFQQLTQYNPVNADSNTLATLLRQQYPVALVDEFQDTDAHQYGIFNAIYPKEISEPSEFDRGKQDCGLDAETPALFMIGDPKQAIYGFRGGDIFTYLQARDDADYLWNMDTNWRSCAPMVAAYNQLFLGSTSESVFQYGIDYHPVNATQHAKANKAPLNDQNGRDGAMIFATLEWLKGDAGDAGDEGNLASGNAPDIRNRIADWTAHEIKRLLSEAMLGDNPLQEKDIAILVRTRDHADHVKDALQRAGLPSVYLSDRSNVYESNQAESLEFLLTGIIDYRDDRRLLRALSTDLMGGTVDSLALMQQEGGEYLWDHWRQRFGHYLQQWQAQGFMPMIMGIVQQQLQPHATDCERALTNYLHLIENLQLASRQYRQPQQLLAWYLQQRSDEHDTTDTEQRLESDANLIRIITLHGSKGLEYPVVFVPFAADCSESSKKESKYCTFQHTEKNCRVSQIGLSPDADAQVVSEAQAEAMRLLYVAITRAEHRCYLGVTAAKGSTDSALGKALGVTSNEAWPEKLKIFKTQANQHYVNAVDCLMVSAAEFSEQQLISQPASTQVALDSSLSARVFSRSTWDSWALHSFTSLSKRQHLLVHTKKDRDYKSDALDEQQTLGSLDKVLDEAINSTTNSATEIDETDLPLQFRLEKGYRSGLLLHDILENIDFFKPDWQPVIDHQLQRYHTDNFQEGNESFTAELQSWLQACLETKFNDGVALAQLPSTQVLKEAEFYFPVESLRIDKLRDFIDGYRDNAVPVRSGGDESTRNTYQQQTYTLNSDTLNGDTLKGMMHGFIDLIFEASGRYYVADYKSSYLGASADCYTPAALAEHMKDHQYDLQYLIYALALHRFLQKRLHQAYSPEKHFGGVYYFYLRGMGVDQEAGESLNGVYYADIPIDQLMRLDAIFSGDV